MTPDKRAKPATIFDVARLAGVSYQTVSRVINDMPNVRPATKARVQNAIAQLRYVPSAAARALVTRRSRNLGLLTTGATDYSSSTIGAHFTYAAQEAQYAVTASSTVDANSGSIRSAVALLLGQHVEAIAVVSDHRATLDILQEIELGVPLIAVSPDPTAVSEPAFRLGFDEYEGAKLATNFLLDLGHREIRHIAGPAGSMAAAERMRGWRAALDRVGRHVVEPLAGAWTPHTGYANGLALAEDETVTAIVAASDDIALGVIHAMTTRGRRVPEDVSVVGFDGSPSAEHVTPPLTSVHLDFSLIGRDMFSTAVQVLAGDPPAQSASHAAQLMVRSSTAPPPGL